MKRADAIPHVKYVVDDSLNGRRLMQDPHAIIRPYNPPGDPNHNYPSVLIGWSMEKGKVSAYHQCPKCHNTLQNSIPADDSTKRRCANCKTVWLAKFLFVSVHSYLDVKIENEKAEKLARDYLNEIGVFGCDGSHCTDDGCKLNSRPADFIIR